MSNHLHIRPVERLHNWGHEWYTHYRAERTTKKISHAEELFELGLVERAAKLAGECSEHESYRLISEIRTVLKNPQNYTGSELIACLDALSKYGIDASHALPEVSHLCNHGKMEQPSKANKVRVKAVETLEAIGLKLLVTEDCSAATLVKAIPDLITLDETCIDTMILKLCGFGTLVSAAIRYHKMPLDDVCIVRRAEIAALPLVKNVPQVRQQAVDTILQIDKAIRETWEAALPAAYRMGSTTEFKQVLS